MIKIKNGIFVVGLNNTNVRLNYDEYKKILLMFNKELEKCNNNYYKQYFKNYLNFIINIDKNKFDNEFTLTKCIPLMHEVNEVISDDSYTNYHELKYIIKEDIINYGSKYNDLVLFIKSYFLKSKLKADDLTDDNIDIINNFLIENVIKFSYENDDIYKCFEFIVNQNQEIMKVRKLFNNINNIKVKILINDPRFINDKVDKYGFMKKIKSDLEIINSIGLEEYAKLMCKTELLKLKKNKKLESRNNNILSLFDSFIMELINKLDELNNVMDILLTLNCENVGIEHSNADIRFAFSSSVLTFLGIVITGLRNKYTLAELKELCKSITNYEEINQESFLNTLYNVNIVDIEKCNEYIYRQISIEFIRKFIPEFIKTHLNEITRKASMDMETLKTFVKSLDIKLIGDYLLEINNYTKINENKNKKRNENEK